MSGSQPHEKTVQLKKPRCFGARGPVRHAVCWLAGGLVALPSVSFAQQWILSPEVELGVEHIENPRLQESGDTRNITGGMLNLGAALRRNTETSSVLIRPAAAIFRYNGDGNEDSEAYYLDFDSEKQGQRSTWRFTGNFRQQQVYRGETTSSEIDDIGIGDDVQTGTGRTFERRQRDMWRFRPGFTFDFTERTALKVDLEYLDTRYDTQELRTAVDYTNSRADVSIVRTLSPDSNVEFGVFAAKYEPDAASRDTDSTGVRVRYEKSTSDISTFFVDVGAQDSNLQSTVNPGEEISETSVLWDVGYMRQLERTRWRFDVGQSVTPSGSGFMVHRDLYRAIMHHQFKPRWSLQFSAVALNTETLGENDVITSNDRDYVRAQATLAYQMSRSWTMEALYSFTRQDFKDIPGNGREHAVRLSLVYQRPVPTQ